MKRRQRDRRLILPTLEDVENCMTLAGWQTILAERRLTKRLARAPDFKAAVAFLETTELAQHRPDLLARVIYVAAIYVAHPEAMR